MLSIFLLHFPAQYEDICGIKGAKEHIKETQLKQGPGNSYKDCT